MFALSFTIYVIFANQIRWQQFELENKSQGRQGEKRHLHHSTGNLWFYIADFSEFQLYIYANLEIHLHIDTAGKWDMAKDEICIAL